MFQQQSGSRIVHMSLQHLLQLSCTGNKALSSTGHFEGNMNNERRVHMFYTYPICGHVAFHPVLLDEAENLGKGADCVISLLHHYFEHHAAGEKNVYLQADNCVGQNAIAYVESHNR